MFMKNNSIFKRDLNIKRMSFLIDKPLDFIVLDSKNNPVSNVLDAEEENEEDQVLEKNFIISLKEKELGALTIPKLFVLPNFEKLKELIKDAIEKK